MADWPYNTTAWQRLRKAHLAVEPLCRGCKPHRLTPANTVDHITAISDGGAPFPGHDGLASYCAPCHSAKTVRGTEAGAVRTTKGRKGCDANGNPLDAAHPWNGGNGYLPAHVIDRRMPADLKPSRIPIVIVTGPPGSGKSSYVRERAGPRDRVICLDTIMAKISGQPEHHAPRHLIGKAMETRNAMLRKLADDAVHERAWFIVAAPNPADRRKWARMLGGELVVLDTPLRECIRRIKADDSRPPERRAEMAEVAEKWWQANPHLVRRSLRAGGTGPSANPNPQLVSNNIWPDRNNG